MPKKRDAGPALLTANDLASGRIVYWTGSAWSIDRIEAMRATSHDDRDDLAARGTLEEAANRVVGAYLVDVADIKAETPLLLRERQRAYGPSITLPVARSTVPAS